MWRATPMTAVRVRRSGRGVRRLALRVQEAQVVTGDPIPAQDDVELRPEVQRGHCDHLAKRLGRAEGQVNDHRRRQQAGGVGRRQADGHGAMRRRDGEVEQADKLSTEAVCGARIEDGGRRPGGPDN